MFRFLLSKIFKSREKMTGEQVKPFLDHLEDLRWTIIKIAITLVLSMVLSFVWHKEIFHLLEVPLQKAGYDPRKVLFLGEFAGAFMIAITLSFYAGIVVSFPLLMFFLAEFVLPALTPREKRFTLPAIAIGFALFLGGAWFCYEFIMPAVTKFMVGFAHSIGIDEKIEARSYFKTVALMAIVFGMMCQVPVVMVTLNLIGIVTYRWIKTTRAYGYAGILTLCAIVSPTPDIPSLALFTVPIIALYEICIWVIYLLDKRREKREAALAAKMDRPYEDEKNEPID